MTGDPTNCTVELSTGRFFHLAESMQEVGERIQEARRHAYTRPFDTETVRHDDPVPTPPGLLRFRVSTGTHSRRGRGFDEILLDPLHVVGVYPLTLMSENP